MSQQYSLLVVFLIDRIKITIQAALDDQTDSLTVKVSGFYLG